MSSSSPAKRIKLGMKMNSFRSEFPQFTLLHSVVKIKLCITFFKGIDILTFKDHMVKLLFRGKVSQSSRKHTFHKHSRTPTMDQNFNEVIYNISFPSNMEDIFTN